MRDSKRVLTRLAPAFLTLAIITFSVMGVYAGIDGEDQKNLETTTKVEKSDKVEGLSEEQYQKSAVTMQNTLYSLGVKEENVDFVRLVGDKFSGTSGKSRKMKIDKVFWGKYFKGAAPNDTWAASGYRKLEIYIKGEEKPKVTIFINELDTCQVSGDPRNLRYRCKGLERWFMDNLK